jgi:hypothetical protein
MPSFLGSWREAEESGMRVERCIYCSNWHWLEKDNHPVRVFCTRKACELKETEARKEEAR